MSAPNFLTYDPETLAPEAVALLPRLSDADAVVRRIALIELADLEDADALQPIVAALRHDDSATVRSEAARVLSGWEKPQIVEALRHALTDVDGEVRKAAASSLSELKDASSGAVLCAWVDRPEPFVNAAVLPALRELRVADAFASALRALTGEVKACVGREIFHGSGVVREWFISPGFKMVGALWSA